MMMMSWQRRRGDNSWIISQCIKSETVGIIPNISFFIQVHFEQKKASQNLRGLIIAALKMDAR
jgi:hypothetical protein